MGDERRRPLMRDERKETGDERQEMGDERWRPLMREERREKGVRST